MIVKSGSLDRVILIEKPTKSRSAVAQEIDTWSALATIRGQRLDLRWTQQVELKPGGENKGPGRSLVATARYLIRYRSDLTIGQRATVDGGTYTISAIEEQDRRQTIILTLAGS